MAQPHGQDDDGDIEMDSDSGSRYEDDPIEQLDSDGSQEFNETQPENDLQDPQPSGQFLPSEQNPPAPAPTYSGAAYWRDAYGSSRPRADVAQYLPSYQRVNDWSFYLDNRDSRTLYDRVYLTNPDDFPPAEQPIPVQYQQNEPAADMRGATRGGKSTRGRGQRRVVSAPRRGQSTIGRGGMPNQGNPPEPPTRDRPNAELWSDVLAFNRPRFEAAQDNFLLSLEDTGRGGFYLNAEDSNTLRNLIRQNPIMLSGPDSEVLNVPAPPARRGRSRGRGRPRGSRGSRGRGRGRARSSPGGGDGSGRVRPSGRSSRGSTEKPEQQPLEMMDLPGAQYWVDDTSSDSRPLRDYAQNNSLNSFQLVNDYSFWLNALESAFLRAAQDLAAQGSGDLALAQTSPPEDRREQPPYEGETVHGTLKHYRWAIANNIPPEQFGLYYDGDWYGPPIDVIDQEIANVREAPEPRGQFELPIRDGPPKKKRNTNKSGRKDAPFDGLLEHHPEWWGSFIDDGPQKPGETDATYRQRIKKSRFNLQIVRRGERPKLPPKEPGQSNEDRNQQTADHRVDFDKVINKHHNKMDPYSDDYDKDYAEIWRNLKQGRKTQNDARRREELAYVRREYASRNLPRFATPEPPEDSGDDDEYYEQPKKKPAVEADNESEEEDTEPNWDADPETFARYRQQHNGREHMRCKNCTRQRKTCTWKEKEFPCNRCLAENVPCVRQPWEEGKSAQGAPRGVVGKKHFRGLQLYVPSRYVREQLGDRAPSSWRIGDPDPPERATGTTAVPPIEPPRNSIQALALSIAESRAKSRVAAAAANAAAPTPANQPVIRCKRCAYVYLRCDKTRPCWQCIRAGEFETCDGSIQNQQFGENAPDDGDDYMMHDHPDDPDGYDNSNIDPALRGNLPSGGAAGNIFGSANAGTQQFAPYNRFGTAMGNISKSISGGTQQLPPPQVPGHQMAPGGPVPGPGPGQVHIPGQGWKRTAPDDDDDLFDNLHVPKKPRGTTAENEALAMAWAVEDSQVNMYNPSGNSVPDTESPLKNGDPFMLGIEDDEMTDAPPRPPTPLPVRLPEYNAPAWTLSNLPIPLQSSAGPRTAWDDTKECKENRDHWKRTQWTACRTYPARDCDHLQDNLQYSCNHCNREQNRIMLDQDWETINASKLFCCANCEQKVIADVEGELPNTRKGTCSCVSQLIETWICNFHREDASLVLKRTVGMKKQEYIEANPGGLMNDSNLCPGCMLSMAAPGATWKCVVCETYVYRDPLAAR